MKILFLLTQDLESPSAIGRYFPLASELAKRGHQVSIAALHSNFASLEKRRFQRDGVEIHYVAQMHVIKRGSRKWYYSPGGLLWTSLNAIWALTMEALRTPVDIVHIAKPHPMNSLAGLAARLLRRKVVFLDCDDHEATSNRFAGGWQQSGVAWFENFTPKHVDQVTTHNSFLHAYLRGLGLPEERITDLPNGVDARRFAAPDEAVVAGLRHSLQLEGCPVVGYIGSLSAASHAVYLLVDAFEQVHRAIPECILLIAGGGEEYDALQETIRRRGLAGAARFTGRIAPDQIASYYRLAGVVVDPVYDEPAARGRMPLKLFESWFSGTPFVCGDVGDRRRVLGDPPAGVLAEPGDAMALAEAILKVLGDPELAAELRRRGLERVQSYTWDRLAVDLEAVYLQLVPDSAHGKRE